MGALNPIEIAAAGGYAAQRYNVPADGTGRKVLDMASSPYTASNANNTTNTIATSYSGTPAIIVKSASMLTLRSNGLVDFSPPQFSLAGAKSVGFWAWNPRATSIPLSLFFSSSGGFSTGFSSLVLAIYPGLNFYLTPLLAGTNLPFSVGADFSAINRIRVRADDAKGTSLTPMSGTDALMIGDFYADPPAQKAKFSIAIDDGLPDLANPYGNAIIGGDGVARPHCFASYVASYGWRCMAYIIANGAGKPGFLDRGQLAAVQDLYDVRFGVHTYSHPEARDIANAPSNAGLRLLGPIGYNLLQAAGGSMSVTTTLTGTTITPSNDATAIAADLDKAQDLMNRWGFPEAAKHVALPQGGFDAFVNQALQTQGFKSVRGVQSAALKINGGVYSAQIQGTQLEPPMQTMTLPSSIQLDNGSVPDATIIGYIDAVIASGGFGTSYQHGLPNSPVTQQKTKLAFDYLKLKEQQGLIDIVTLY